MKKRLISIITICCMILSVMPVTVSAAQPPQIETQWTNTMGTTANMSFDGNVGYVSISIVGYSGVSNISADIKLYYKNTAGVWKEIIQNWSYDVDQMILSKEESFTAVAGREYKIELTATVYKDGYAEPISKTATAKCPTSP